MDPRQFVAELPAGWSWTQEHGGLLHRMQWFLLNHHHHIVGHLTANRDMTWTARENPSGLTLLNGGEFSACVAVVMEHALASGTEWELLKAEGRWQTETGRWGSSQPNLQNIARLGRASLLKLRGRRG